MLVDSLGLRYRRGAYKRAAHTEMCDNPPLQRSSSSSKTPKNDETSSRCTWLLDQAPEWQNCQKVLEKLPEDTWEEEKVLEKLPQDTWEEDKVLEKLPQDTWEEEKVLEKLLQDTWEEEKVLENLPQDTWKEENVLENLPEDTWEVEQVLEEFPEDTWAQESGRHSESDITVKEALLATLTDLTHNQTERTNKETLGEHHNKTPTTEETPSDTNLEN